MEGRGANQENADTGVQWGRSLLFSHTAHNNVDTENSNFTERDMLLYTEYQAVCVYCTGVRVG